MEIYESADRLVAARENGHFKENGCDQVEKQRLLSVPRYEELIGQIIIVTLYMYLYLYLSEPPYEELICQIYRHQALSDCSHKYEPLILFSGVPQAQHQW